MKGRLLVNGINQRTHVNDKGKTTSNQTASMNLFLLIVFPSFFIFFLYSIDGLTWLELKSKQWPLELIYLVNAGTKKMKEIKRKSRELSLYKRQYQISLCTIFVLFHNKCACVSVRLKRTNWKFFNKVFLSFENWQFKMSNWQRLSR